MRTSIKFEVKASEAPSMGIELVGYERDADTMHKIVALIMEKNPNVQLISK
jgi:hypothetical protein